MGSEKEEKGGAKKGFSILFYAKSHCGLRIGAGGRHIFHLFCGRRCMKIGGCGGRVGSASSINREIINITIYIDIYMASILAWFRCIYILT